MLHHQQQVHVQGFARSVSSGVGIGEGILTLSDIKFMSLHYFGSLWSWVGIIIGGSIRAASAAAAAA